MIQRYGDIALEHLVVQKIVERELRRRNVHVTPEQVQREFDELSEQIMRQSGKPLSEFIKERELDEAARERGYGLRLEAGTQCCESETG